MFILNTIEKTRGEDYLKLFTVVLEELNKWSGKCSRGRIDEFGFNLEVVG